MHSDKSWYRMWESYIKCLSEKYGTHKPGTDHKVIPPITAHWLRHTFITLMYLAGVDIVTAKEQAGHKDIQTTLQYTPICQKNIRKRTSKCWTIIYRLKHLDTSIGCQIGCQSAYKWLY